MLGVQENNVWEGEWDERRDRWREIGGGRHKLERRQIEEEGDVGETERTP